MAATTENQQEQRRDGQNVGRKAHWKRAIVTLADGDRIEIFEG